MTEKQTHIILAASELFSEEGYHAISTKKIAQKAGVSEGLIFRHFNNKAGLIQAILDLNETHINTLINPILIEEDAKQIISKTLELPFILSKNEIEYWRLHFKLKWELNQGGSNTFKPLEDILKKAFTKLKYKKPDLECNLVIHILINLIATRVLGKIQNKNLMLKFLFQKYYLE